MSQRRSPGADAARGDTALREVVVLFFSGRCRAHRALAAAATAAGAVAVFAATGAAAPVEPSLQREALAGDAEITSTVVDPLQVGIDAAVAGGAGSAQCFGH